MAKRGWLCRVFHFSIADIGIDEILECFLFIFFEVFEIMDAVQCFFIEPVE